MIKCIKNTKCIENATVNVLRSMKTYEKPWHLPVWVICVTAGKSRCDVWKRFLCGFSTLSQINLMCKIPCVTLNKLFRNDSLIQLFLVLDSENSTSKPARWIFPFKNIPSFSHSIPSVHCFMYHSLDSFIPCIQEVKVRSFDCLC